MASEDDILAMLGDYFPVNHKSLLLGRGDDCAIVRAGGPWAVTCDIFAEDAHFRRRYFSGYDVGFKALAVNVSDLASAGAQPQACVVGLTLTGTETEDWLRGFAQGLAALAQKHGMALAGGDLTRAAALNVCITAWGDLAHADLRRGRAQAGDILFLVGEVGLARVGLLALEASDSDGAHAKAEWPLSCSQHLRPEPHAAAGVLLARFAASTAEPARFSLMDVSDGLARDVPRLLDMQRTGLRAVLELDPGNLPDEVQHYAARCGLDAAEFAFLGGEDYALLGSCPAPLWAQLQTQWQDEQGVQGVPLRRIGFVADAEISEQEGCGAVLLNGQSCTQTGFDHFSA